MARAADRSPIPVAPGVGVLTSRLLTRIVPAAALAAAVVSCGGRQQAAGASLVDDAGVTVELASPPRRVVSLIPAATELVFALGAGGRLVGRTAWCDWPPEAAAIPSLGNGIDPSVEAVLGTRPDLVLLYRSGSNRNAAERLRALGTPVLELAFDTIEDLRRISRLLGTALGEPAGSDSVLARLDRELAPATARIADTAARPSVVLIVWDRPPMVLGRGSFLSEIVERAGARNAFGDLAASSAPVSIEAIAARDPDLILVSGDGDPAFAGRAEWQVVRAARERRFLRVTGSEYNRPSPRLPQAVASLADSLRRRGR
ncbi:MAG: ABC transporter substrate-binding protein [Gemmatimonadales bacterium]